jgi:O-antigen ligase
MMLHRIFFYLTVLFLPTQLGLHFWPEWTMVLGRKIDYLSPTIYLTDVLVVATIAFWIWMLVSEYIIQNRELRKSGNIRLTSIPYLRYLTFSIGFIVINVLMASSRPVAIYHWVRVFEFMALGFYIIKTKPNLAKIIFLLSINVIYTSLIALVQFFLQHSLGGIFWYLGERTFSVNTPGIARAQLCGWRLFSCQLLLRSYATFPHPNVLGGFLAVTLPIILSFYLSGFTSRWRLKNKLDILFIISLILGTVALIVTFSRSAWVVAGLGLLFVGINYFNKRCLKKMVCLKEFRIMNNKWGRFIFGLLSIITILYSVFSLQNLSRIFPTDESIVARNELNQAAIKMISRSPIFGVGLGNYLVDLPNYLVSRQIYFLQPVHNIYLLLLSELGFIGVLLLFAIGYLLNRKFKQNNIPYPLLTILLLGLFDHYFLTLQQGQLLLTLLISLNLIYY